MGNKVKENDVQQARNDWFMDSINYATSPAEKTPEGFLIARAPATSVGVFSYRNADGTPRYELRLPEEVFAEESLNSLKMKPLTLLHPDQAVTPDNVEQLQVGSVGSDIDTDSYRVYIQLAVTKADGIEAVESGSARALSCGYTCDIEWTSGTWMGVHYDCIQRNIRYNHVALVPVARAGDGNAIRMDGFGELEKLPENYKPTNEEKMNLKTIHLDGADFQAEPQVIAALDKAQKRADEAEKELSQLRTDSKAAAEKAAAEKAAVEAERDTFKERLDAMEKEMPSKIDAAVKSRLDIVSKATAAGVEVRDDMAESDIKKAVVKKYYPNANLDGQEKAYINARFDCACEQAAKEAENKSRQDAAETNHHNVNPTAQEKLEASKKAYNERMDTAWQDKPNK